MEAGIPHIEMELALPIPFKTSDARPRTAVGQPDGGYASEILQRDQSLSIRIGLSRWRWSN